MDNWQYLFSEEKNDYTVSKFSFVNIIIQKENFLFICLAKRIHCLSLRSLIERSILQVGILIIA